MNQPPKSFVLVQEKRLLAFATACFEKVGLEREHAALVSRLLVNNDLRGVRSHGSRTVDMYCEGFERGAANPRPELKVLHETPTSVVLDGDGTIGYMPMTRAAEGAIAKAQAVGNWDRTGATYRSLRLGGSLLPNVHGSRLHRVLIAGTSEHGKCGRQGVQTASRLLRKSAHQLCHTVGK